MVSAVSNGWQAIESQDHPPGCLDGQYSSSRRCIFYSFHSADFCFAFSKKLAEWIRSGAVSKLGYQYTIDPPTIHLLTSHDTEVSDVLTQIATKLRESLCSDSKGH